MSLAHRPCGPLWGLEASLAECFLLGWAPLLLLGSACYTPLGKVAAIPETREGWHAPLVGSAKKLASLGTTGPSDARVSRAVEIVIIDQEVKHSFSMPAQTFQGYLHAQGIQNFKSAVGIGSRF